MVRRKDRPVAEDDRMEAEAASALAGLARCPAAPTGGDLGSGHSEEQISVATAISNSEKISEEMVENIPRQVCSTSCKSNRVRKLKSKFTEAEKEAQKVSRVLANRESARETIRRRQASYVELTGKETELLEENEILKKEIEVAVKEYNSLRDRNEGFKAQLAKLKRIEAGDSRSDEVFIGVASAAENTGHGLLGDENEEPVISPDRKSDDEVFAATVARRRRKQLMKLKDNHCHDLDLSL